MPSPCNVSFFHSYFETEMKDKNAQCTFTTNAEGLKERRFTLAHSQLHQHPQMNRRAKLVYRFKSQKKYVNSLYIVWRQKYLLHFFSF